MIDEKFGIKVSLPTVARLLKKHNFKLLKSDSLPAKADPEKQRTFYQEVLLALMEKAKKGTIVLLSVDAAHFVMGCDYLGPIWCQTRRFLKTFSGRARYNVLSALDLASKKLTTVTNDTYITATQICELLKKIATEYAGQVVYLTLDNARYQKCKLVQELAAQLGIILVNIPTYSPNLNLIERLWKNVKFKLRTKYYDNFSEFSAKIDSILRFENIKDKKNLDKLISEKVQLFDNLVPIGGSTFTTEEVKK